jgi:anhydro-N-acetylmuramic acid kinase
VYFIGLMSGTSVDAIDAALVDITDNQLSLIAYDQYPIPSPVQTAIRTLSSTTPIANVSELDAILGELFAEAVNTIIVKGSLKPADITATGSHGQTILHLPQATYPRTLQIGDPNIIAVKTGITTVADFRRSDIAAGGQGAPLASAFHAWRFRSNNLNRIVLNLGGMANITVLPADITQPVSGFDTGPGNALMDDWTQRHLHRDYDHNGEWATSGTCDNELLNLMLDETFFHMPSPKSTGRDDFNLDWLEQKRMSLNKLLPPEDVQATLLELTARTISDAVLNSAPSTQEILLCGGGTHNLALVQRLRQLLLNQRIVSTEQHGIHPDAVEAVTFAWLAKYRLDNSPANIPAVTGASRPVVLGAVYHG